MLFMSLFYEFWWKHDCMVCFFRTAPLRLAMLTPVETQVLPGHKSTVTPTGALRVTVALYCQELIQTQCQQAVSNLGTTFRENSHELNVTKTKKKLCCGSRSREVSLSISFTGATDVDTHFFLHTPQRLQENTTVAPPNE